MEIRKLTQIGGNGSHGVVLPKDDLRDMGLLEKDNQHVRVVRDEDKIEIHPV